MLNKKLFVVALGLLALISIGGRKANAQSCPNRETFGTHGVFPVDRTAQAEIQVTYFTTDDPNVFISERAGISRSASFTLVDTNQFVARINQLEKEGAASIKKQQGVSAYLGEISELNLERNAASADARMINARLSSPNDIHQLDRETQVSVYRGRREEGDFYHVSLLSWFVGVAAGGRQKTVDYDANILLKPGQTAVIKLMSDNEVKRRGAARSYMAVTMRSVNDAGAASLERRHTAVALR